MLEPLKSQEKVLFHYSKERGDYLTPEIKKGIEIFQKKLKDGTYLETDYPCMCKKTDDLLIADHDRYGIPVRTVLCRKCGLMRSTPYLTEKSLSLFYDQDYDSIYRISIPSNEFFLNQLRQGNSILSSVQKIESKLSGKVVFEIGCSKGGNLLPFQQIGCSVYGADYNSSHVAEGRKMGLDLRLGSVDTLSQLPPADILILNHVLEHVIHPIDFLEKCYSLLKPEGLLYVAVPAIENIEDNYNYNIFTWLQNAHFYYFSNITLKNVVASAGGEIIWDNSKGIVIARKKQKTDYIYAPNEARRIVYLLKHYEKIFSSSDVNFKNCLKFLLPYGIVRFIQESSKKN